MSLNNVLKLKHQEICNIIEMQYLNEKRTGGLIGTSGLALFYFYSAKYCDSEKYYNHGLEIINSSFKRVNSGEVNPSYCYGLAGLGWVMDHLLEKDFIEHDNDAVLSSLDDHLLNFMVKDIRNGFYDFLHAAIGYGYYFLNRYKNTKNPTNRKKYKTNIIILLQCLIGAAEKQDGKFKWMSTIRLDTGEEGYNISLAHGMSSIINFCSRVLNILGQVEKNTLIIESTLKYILDAKIKNRHATSIFPNWIKPNGEPDTIESRIAWCYGDLGIGLSIWHAARALNDNQLERDAIELLLKTTDRRLEDETKIADATICHGSFGNAQIYNRLYAETKNYRFKETAEFWINDGMSRLNHETGPAGYKQWNAKTQQWDDQYSVLEGVSGVGLSIISQLSGFNDWDECLMIG